MLFKVDENLPIEIAEILINGGHDAKTISVIISLKRRLEDERI